MQKNKIEYRTEGIWGKTPISILPFVTCNELKSYVALASFQGNSDNCWPSLEEVAKRAGLSTQATSEAISGLVEKGFVIRKRNFGKANNYRVLIPTIEPEKDDYPENHDNSIKADNSENPGVSYPEKSGDGLPGKPDGILKEHIKTTIEKKNSSSIQDPYFPTATTEEVNMVLDIIQDHLDRHYKRVAVNKLQRREATQVFQNLREEDKPKQLKDMLNLYTFGEGNDKNKYWLETTPQPKILFKAWDSLVNLRLPLWFEKGFTSQLEYETHLSATRPESHSSMRELKDQFFSGPTMSKEQADDFMNQLDELKEELNGKT